MPVAAESAPEILDSAGKGGRQLAVTPGKGRGGVKIGCSD